MSLIKHNRFPTHNFLADFFDTEKLFSNSLLTNEWIPSVNVVDNEKDYAIEIAAPGMKKEDFKINVENSILNISAEREESKEEENKNYTRREFTYNSFSRSFTLPENASEDNISAKYENGLLKLSLAKKAIAAAPKKKEVAVA